MASSTTGPSTPGLDRLGHSGTGTTAKGSSGRPGRPEANCHVKPPAWKLDIRSQRAVRAEASAMNPPSSPRRLEEHSFVGPRGHATQGLLVSAARRTKPGGQV